MKTEIQKPIKNPSGSIKLYRDGHCHNKHCLKPLENKNEQCWECGSDLHLDDKVTDTEPRIITPLTTTQKLTLAITALEKARGWSVADETLNLIL